MMLKRYPPGVYPPFYLLICALLLQSCATIQAEDLSKRLYVTDVVVMESWRLAGELRQAGQISDEDWPKVKSGLTSVSEGLNEAWARYKTDPDAAADSLNSIEGLLAEVKQWLTVAQSQSLRGK